MTFKRPKADYKPQGNLPNVDEFQRIAHEKKPNSSRLLDALANYIMDALNNLKKIVDEATVNLLPGADDLANKDKPVVSDGTTYVFKKLTGINLEADAITEREIKDLSVEKEKIQLQAVGTDQLEDGAVTTPKIADGTITAIKVQPLPLSKIRSTGNVSLVIGQAGGSHYTELSYMGAPKLVLPAVGDDGVLKLYNLSSIWYYSPVEYEGSKLRNLTTSLAKLLSSNKNTILVGKTDTSVGELDCNKGVLSVAANGGVPAFAALADLVNAEQNNINGNVITDNTLNTAKITQLSGVKFFDAGYYSNNQRGDFYLFKNFTAVRTDVGLYDFTIKTGYRTDYFIVSVAFAGNSFRYYVTQTTTYSFRVTVTGGEAPFSIMIIGYQ
jgi:hypothetical protein